MKTKRRRQGFTLLEVMLVLAILLIIGGAAGVAVVKMQKSGFVKSAENQINGMKGMLDLYYIDMGTYPADLSALRIQPSGVANADKWGGPYADTDIPPDPWGNRYQYELISADQYRVWSMGPDMVSGSDDDIQRISG